MVIFLGYIFLKLIRDTISLPYFFFLILFFSEAIKWYIEPKTTKKKLKLTKMVRGELGNNELWKITAQAVFSWSDHKVFLMVKGEAMIPKKLLNQDLIIHYCLVVGSNSLDIFMLYFSSHTKNRMNYV